MSERGADLELLGLAAGEPVTHDQVRRAYLRRLRLHPPERDPEGFRRLREAFERLEPWARLQDLLRATTAERDAAGRAGRDDASAKERDACEEVEREPAAKTERREASDVERMAAGDVERMAAGDVERMAAGDVERMAARDVERVAAGDLERMAAGDVERGAAAEVKGEDAVARANGSREPGRGRPERPAEAHGEPGVPGELPPAIVVKLGSWGRVAAAPTGATVDDEPESLGSVIEEILGLLDRGELDAARALAEQWNRSALDDHREVSPVDAQRWALTRELIDVARRLPDSLRRALVRGIRDDDLTVAYAAAESYQARYPVEANELAQTLARRAPNLRTSLGVLLGARRNTGQAGGQSGPSPFRLIWIAVVLLSALARAAGSCDSHDRVRNFPREPVTLPAPQGSPPWRELPPGDPSRPEVHPQPERWFERQAAPPVDLYGHGPSPERGAGEPGAGRPDGVPPPSQR